MIYSVTFSLNDILNLLKMFEVRTLSSSNFVTSLVMVTLSLLQLTAENIGFKTSY